MNFSSECNRYHDVSFYPMIVYQTDFKATLPHLSSTTSSSNNVTAVYCLTWLVLWLFFSFWWNLTCVEWNINKSTILLVNPRKKYCVALSDWPKSKILKQNKSSFHSPPPSKKKKKKKNTLMKASSFVQIENFLKNKRGRKNALMFCTFGCFWKRIRKKIIITD